MRNWLPVSKKKKKDCSLRISKNSKEEKRCMI